MAYDVLADHYDCLFPLKKKTLDFLRENLPEGRVLDSACGTGSYTLALAENGYEVEGHDLSGAMIEIAKAKAKTKNLAIRFQRKDMAKLAAKGRYEGVFCIGNSLVHLPSKKAILDYLNRVQKSLKNQGRAIFQIVNYDLIYGKKIATLPKIECPGLVFERHYERKHDTVLFRQILKTPRGNKENVERLYPLKSNKFKSLLKKAGFSGLSFYGGFEKESFASAESFSLVVVAEKEEGTD